MKYRGRLDNRAPPGSSGILRAQCRGAVSHKLGGGRQHEGVAGSRCSTSGSSSTVAVGLEMGLGLIATALSSALRGLRGDSDVGLSLPGAARLIRRKARASPPLPPAPCARDCYGGCGKADDSHRLALRVLGYYVITILRGCLVTHAPKTRTAPGRPPRHKPTAPSQSDPGPCGAPIRP
jgi:hypothetical protein